jgi:hypothetical protein
MEEITDSVIAKEEEDGDLLVYCAQESEKDILIKRKDKVYYSSLIGRF